jgi:hypothetical protein
MQHTVFIMHLRWPAASMIILEQCCAYSIVPPDDEWFIFSKHVEDDY